MSSTPTTTPTATTTQIYRVFIKATPEAIWEAITSPEWTARYGYRGPIEYDLQPGGPVLIQPSDQMRAMGMNEPVGDGEVVSADPPHRLVQTYRLKFSPEMTDEGHSTVTWDIHPEHDGITRLTVIHDVTDRPVIAAVVSNDEPLNQGGGGWAWILSDLKSLLETGQSIGG